MHHRHLIREEEHHSIGRSTFEADDIAGAWREVHKTVRNIPILPVEKVSNREKMKLLQQLVLGLLPVLMDTGVQVGIQRWK